MNGSLHLKGPSTGSLPFDVCVVGHVTKDILKVGQTTTLIPGGTAYYTAAALKGLGLNVAVVTKGAKEDRDYLLHELLSKGTSVFWKEGKATTVFENSYSGDDLGARTQVLKSMGTPLLAKDVARIRARAFHLGPLFGEDIPLQVLKQVSAKAEIVSLDAQGMVRPPKIGPVTEQDWAEKKKWLKLVHILKADEREALILSGERDVRKAGARLASFGPREVVITLDNRGSIVFAQGAIYDIPSFRPKRLKDPTGCGDTFTAGYLYERLRNTPPNRAGRFAATMATLKLEGPGPFRGSEADVRRRLASLDES